MNPILRSILAIVPGTVAAMLVIMLNDGLCHVLFPLPQGVDLNDMDSVRAALPAMPAAMFVLLMAGWPLGAFCGGLLCAWIAGRAPLMHAGIIGVIVLLSTVANLTLLPHPLWVNVLGVLLPLPAALLAGFLAPGQRPATPALG